MIPREQTLRRRIRACTSIIIIGLVLSGATALPLQTELDILARWLHAENLSPAQATSGFVQWILIVRDALHDTYAKHPFMGYGTDWLAFAHLVIAVAFLGPLRDPVRNQWVLVFGVIACLGVLPLALIAGPIRGIPVYWRLIDCSFGIIGAVPLLICLRYVRQIERDGSSKHQVIPVP